MIVCNKCSKLVIGKHSCICGMTRDEAERILAAWNDKASEIGFDNRKFSGAFIRQLLVAHNVIAGARIPSNAGVPTRPAQPGRPRV